ncbi:MAG: methanogenesis marker protein 6 [Candidatus Methanomethylophilaceae archaeon]|jgi:putative methanogenesis marker protein 6|nr:methanogenesis marker protein 6 [Candidatus Methanomethylophilaceae archaeon]
MSESRETRLFMISPRSMLTPDQLVRMVHAFGEEALIKETCYGCLVEGPRELVLKIRDKVREEYRNEVFTKIRAYPCSDPRRCRAQHGTRPGFAQLEEEWALLARVQHGLNEVDKGAKYVAPEAKKRISVNDFKKICEVK